MTHPSADQIRLLTYNILLGGMGRLDPIYETLLYLDADVIGLCEASDPAAVKYLADKLEYDYVLAESPTSDMHVAMLSRLPIQSMVNLGAGLPTVSRAAMASVVEVSGKPLRVNVVHLMSGLDAEAEKIRLRELDAILANIQRGEGPVVLMGDLNASAPYHPFNADHVDSAVRDRIDARGGKLDYDVIERLTSLGWVDAYHRRHPNDPQHTFSTGFPALRVDYIWLGGELADALADCDIERGGFCPYCSDHYPVWADLRMA